VSDQRYYFREGHSAPLQGTSHFSWFSLPCFIFNSTILQVGSMHFTAKLPEDYRKRNAKRLSTEDICLPSIGHGLRVANLASTSSSYSGSVNLAVFVTNVI
jgi:hypothetical protein